MVFVTTRRYEQIRFRSATTRRSLAGRSMVATGSPPKSSCGRFAFTRNSLVPPGLRGCRLSLLEVSGSLGDLGTFIPLLVGMANQGSIDFASALFWAGAFNVLTGAAWDVPMWFPQLLTQFAEEGFVIVGPTVIKDCYLTVEIIDFFRFFTQLPSEPTVFVEKPDVTCN